MIVEIRLATENDFEEIHELIKEMALFENMADKVINTVERMKAESEYLNCFVAESFEKRILGYATFFFTYHTFVGKSLYMDDLYVKSELRGKSIGTQLINKVIDYARNSGCHKLRWQVSKWNTPAINFYQSLGAQIDNIEQNCDLLLD